MIKKKILFIFHVSTLGGGSYCLLNIIKQIDNNYYTPIVLLKNEGPLVSELQNLETKVFFEKRISTVPYNNSILKYSSLRQWISVLISINRIRRWIKKTQADIVHINTMMLHPYCKPAYKLGVKVIIHIREHWPKNEHNKQLNWARKNIKRYSHQVIAINETSADIINEPEKTKIIYDWIDFSGRNEFIDFNVIFGENYKNLKIFLFLGGFQKIKGALEVVTTFNKNIKTKEARLLFVGCKSKKIEFYGLKGKIKRVLHVIKYYSYSDKVKNVMQKDNRIICIPATYQVKSLIEQSYCLVSFPTIPHAILPIAEAIFLGKPVISAITPEAIEYSNDGESALFFKLNDINSFTLTWNYTIENKANIYKKSDSGKSIIRKKFAVNKNSTELNNLYKNLFKEQSHV